MKVTHKKFGTVELVSQDEYAVYSSTGIKINKQFGGLVDEQQELIVDFSRLPLKGVQKNKSLNQIKKVILKPESTTKKIDKKTIIMCGVSKETEKALEIAVSNRDGLHFLWVPKSKVDVIFKSEESNSYGFTNCFAAKIELPNWLFKNFIEKGIKEVKDDCGEVFSTKLRYITS